MVPAAMGDRLTASLSPLPDPMDRPVMLFKSLQSHCLINLTRMVIRTNTALNVKARHQLIGIDKVPHSIQKRKVVPSSWSITFILTYPW